MTFNVAIVVFCVYCLLKNNPTVNKLKVVKKGMNKTYMITAEHIKKLDALKKAGFVLDPDADILVRDLVARLDAISIEVKVEEVVDEVVEESPAEEELEE